MHRSRLGGLVIDCRVDDLQRAARFWSDALGYGIRRSNAPQDEGYVLLQTAPEAIHIELQRVGHPSRVHLDIETDDVDGEVARLEQLGAKRVKKVRDWWVMEAPTGHRFCVVSAPGESMSREANAWE